MAQTRQRERGLGRKVVGWEQDAVVSAGDGPGLR